MEGKRTINLLSEKLEGQIDTYPVLKNLKELFEQKIQPIEFYKEI